MENINIESREIPKKEAIVFVPGLGESALVIYEDVVSRLNDEGVEMYSVSTHPEEESQRQDEISKEKSKSEYSNKLEVSPITCFVSDEEGKKHDSFQDRVDITNKAIESSIENTKEKLTIVGHSAGGLAVLQAVTEKAREYSQMEEGTERPKIHAILLAPALPKETPSAITVGTGFIKLILKDTFSLNGHSYLRKIITGKDIDMADEDARFLLGENNDEDYTSKLKEGSVPISGKEGMDLLKKPEVLNDISPEGWPDDIEIDVVIARDDQWVSTEGQEKLVNDVLQDLTRGKTASHIVDGGHIVMGEEEGRIKVIELIEQKDN